MFSALRTACGEQVYSMCTLVGRTGGIISTALWSRLNSPHIYCAQRLTSTHRSPYLSIALFTPPQTLPTTINPPPFAQYPQHLLLLERDKEFKKG